MNFYEEKKLYFQERYWKKGKGELLRVNGLENGISDVEAKIGILLREISKSGKILDLGCGNGLLLRILRKKSHYPLIPFGVDFLEKSILQAKTKVLPEFGKNFFVDNVIFWKTKEVFDYIILDPESVRDRDIESFYETYTKHLSSNGKMIWFITPDSIPRLQEREKTLPFLERIGEKKTYKSIIYYLV